MTVRVRGVRDQADDTEAAGTRVLVDRLWPRGLRKADAPHDEWCRDVAPSTELRRWFAHAPERFEEFGHRYREELRSRPEAADALDRLRATASSGTLTLLTATRDLEISHARVLADVLAGG